jgi:hypothetical protein
MNHRSGVSLVECLVYVAVFGILLGGGTAAFYFCWDHTRATVFTTDKIECALRAGEVWRADVRAATGKISVSSSASGEMVSIPQGDKEICYLLAGGELRREIPSQNLSRLVFEKVTSSGMSTELRGGVTAWRWELELPSYSKAARLPLRFTFEAVQPKP